MRTKRNGSNNKTNTLQYFTIKCRQYYIKKYKIKTKTNKYIFRKLFKKISRMKGK